MAHHVLRVSFATALAICLGMISAATGNPASNVSAQGSFNVATWQPWVLESLDQFRVEAPPDEAGTVEEMAQLLTMAASRDEAALNQIAYWNSGPPAYRWNQIALDTMLRRTTPGPVAFRQLALLHAAIYDGTIAAWDSKYMYERPRPSLFDSSLTTAIDNPSSPSYPSEYAVTAGAASAVLSWLYPDGAQTFADMAQEAVTSRLLAGVEYPSDVEAGLELGRQVAELVIARGEADGFSAPWTGSVPTEPGHWTGENPVLPTAGTWQPWVLESPDQFRPAPPPAYDSEQLAAEMEELRSFERTPATNASAMFWEFGAGGRHIHWFWNDVANQLILASGWEDHPPVAARAYALTNIAAYDSMVACWDAKYTYWAMRPFQLDPEFTPLFTTPGHPSYPSAHSCISTAAASVLAYLFPADSERLMTFVSEVGDARMWGGIHFRSDIVAGTELGHNVADAVITHAMGDGL
jgi:membrane-associated phospholipid phosphatase